MSSNLHTHTVYCDGHDTPEELVETALSLGCDCIGFSGHSFTDIPEDEPFCMTREGTKEYKACIRRLNQVYAGRITVLLGVEQDYFSEESTEDYEYVIGSVHYVYKDGVYLPVDASAKAQLAAVEKYYHGDFYAFIEDYYALVADVYRKTRCDIVGHFDLITKFNEKGELFDTAHPRYIAAADRALDSLLGENTAFEINYGAIARGYRKTPYPEEWILQRLKKSGAKLIRTSDCHRKEQLLFGISGE